MSDKVNYSIVNTEAGNIAVRSTVKSFNLDHVTEKDIVSFYNHFSQYAAWDTGLLPVDGSGILSIRTAGVYTQFAYQHKPGLYHINWSRSEGSIATAYYLAQPYRIIICDMKEGNLLGARMFYSPYPITNPSQQLYHVNLPNTNCKGYRNNGVGWQCLYQNEDWSALPLNERIVRFIERCSGVETFNDGNMSETDGPRFYRENNKPEFLWNPILWQQKSEEEGFEWTLDESLWIPVLVTDKDNQTKHDPKGNPLTLADALVGDYRAYYYDDQETKPINAIIRPDKELSAKDVMQHFVNAYTSATSQTTHILNNTFESSQKVKENKGSSEFKGSSLLFSPENHQVNDHDDDDDDDDENLFYCESCESEYHTDEQAVDAYGNSVCIHCISSHYVHIPSVDGYFHNEDNSIVYSEYLSEYYHTTHDTIQSCECGEIYGVSGFSKAINYVIQVPSENTSYCPSCVDTYAGDVDHEISSCHTCDTKFINHEDFSTGFTSTLIANPKYIFNEDGTKDVSIENITVTLCPTCVNNYFICPCGYLKTNPNKTDMNSSISHVFISGNNDVEITSCCASCTNINFDTSDPTLEFKPQNPDYKKYHLELNTSGLVSGLQIGYKVTPGEPF